MKAGKIRLFLLLAASAVLAAPLRSPAQDKDAPKGDKIFFLTADSVKIRGNWYGSDKKKAPVVILLHALGEDSRRESWQNLAGELQKAGLNVLSFDFRGHGESTEIDEPEKFWSATVMDSRGGFSNPNLMAAGAPPKKALVGKRSIEFKNFDKLYYPYLINDIAAARSYLERTKNDDGSCSTSSIIVIGADTGATLGAAWITSEWFRFKFTPPMMAGMNPEIEKRAEGRDIIAAIYLTMSAQLADKRPVRIENVVRVPANKGNTSMLFLYGDGDKTGKKVALSCEQAVTKEGKNKYTRAFELKTKLTGAELLQKSLETDTAIRGYLGALVADKANEWSERDFRKSYYCRITPDLPGPMPIKVANDQNLMFESYDKFLPN